MPTPRKKHVNNVFKYENIKFHVYRIAVFRFLDVSAFLTKVHDYPFVSSVFLTIAYAQKYLQAGKFFFISFYVSAVRLLPEFRQNGCGKLNYI